MARTKKSIGVYALSSGFEGFSEDSIVKLSDALGASIPQGLAEDLESEINGWLLRFRDFKSVRYGSQEKRNARRVEASANNLLSALNELGALSGVLLDEFAYGYGVKNGDIIEILRSLTSSAEVLGAMEDKELNVAAMQIHALAGALEDNGFGVTVTHDNLVTAYKPSGFVKFVAALWEEYPELCLYQTHSANRWHSLSQWVSARLSEPPEFERMRLQGRRKLE